MQLLPHKMQKVFCMWQTSMALWANFFVIQNVYINVNLTVKEGNQSFPYENHCKCYKKLTSRLWLVLSTLTHFFLVHTLSSSAGKKSCCDSCFPLQIRPKTTVQWYILREYSFVWIGFNMINKCHKLCAVYTVCQNILSLNHCCFTKS